MSSGSPAPEGDADVPVLRVVSGDATAEEVAALVAALAAAAGMTAAALPPEPAAPVEASRWADRCALLRVSPAPGPGAWQASAWRR